MKVKLDENIPHTVCRRLALRGLDVDTVPDAAVARLSAVRAAFMDRRGGRALRLNHYNLDLIQAEQGLQ